MGLELNETGHAPEFRKTTDAELWVTCVQWVPCVRKSEVFRTCRCRERTEGTTASQMTLWDAGACWESHWWQLCLCCWALVSMLRTVEESHWAQLHGFGWTLSGPLAQADPIRWPRTQTLKFTTLSSLLEFLRGVHIVAVLIFSNFNCLLTFLLVK